MIFERYIKALYIRVELRLDRLCPYCDGAAWMYVETVEADIQCPICHGTGRYQGRPKDAAAQIFAAIEAVEQDYREQMDNDAEAPVS